jgi:hypothetical protein
VAPEYRHIVLIEVYTCSLTKHRYADPDNPMDILTVQASATAVLAVADRVEDDDQAYVLRVLRWQLPVDRTYEAYAPAGRGCDDFVVGRRMLKTEATSCCDTGSCDGPKYLLMDINPGFADELLAMVERVQKIAVGDISVFGR